MSEVILEAQHVTKHFSIPGRPVRNLVACQEVSLSLRMGQTLGLAGESGCGKSTFARTLVGLQRATSGSFIHRGRDLAGLSGEERRKSRRHIQMVFQDPLTAFNPRMTIEDIVCEPLFNFGLLRKKNKRDKTVELLKTVDLPGDYAARRPRDLSGGQRQRVGLARALALEPEIIICDEATSALDVSVQQKIVELLTRLQRERGLAILFICHDLALLQSLSHQAAIMYLGRVVEVLGNGRIEQAVHPYTRALLDSIFPTRPPDDFEIKTISSELPSPLDIPSGCSFHNRCEQSISPCLNRTPPLVEIAPGHQVACHLYVAAGAERNTI